MNEVNDSNEKELLMKEINQNFNYILLILSGLLIGLGIMTLFIIDFIFKV